ncbi:hypothetical protein [Herbaspirillum chlorophenolicum]|uniref:hypothetical protein n=1 Tax=Herbaspirillum chlorophenolicum TaxID=211589 RepID=UPI00067CB7A7|nr:hypothetical protein [Herbaspirillum chlorophenolicum]
MNQNSHSSPTQSVGDTLCDRHETKAILAIGDSTYWALIREGSLEIVRFGKKCTRVKRSSIDALMNKSVAA